MNARTEWLKLRTTRVPVATLLAVPVFAGLVTFAVFSTAGRDGNPVLGTPGSSSLADVLGAPHSLLTTVLLVLGVLLVTSEFRHDTITTTLLAEPRRARVVAAKAICAAAVGAGAAITSLAVTAGVAVPWLRSRSLPAEVDGDVVKVAAGLVLVCALHATIGVGVGALVRNQTLAVGAVFVWLLATEGLLGDVWGSGVAQWLPASAGAALVRVSAGASHLDWAPALGVTAAYSAGLWALGSVAVTRRDVA